jgi:heme/copper-type cytochrome/quinol oxidase subunit 3
MSARPKLDVSQLPDVVFGRRSIMSWGMFGMMLIEGTMFGIVLATYFYLRTRTSDWPPEGYPPVLVWGTINTAIFLLSLIPNVWISKIAEEGDLKKARLGVWIMTLIGVANMVIRVLEFGGLKVHWDTNAYGSILWTTLGLHTAHLITDWYDTLVLLVLLYTGPIEGRTFMDVSENAEYWYFVVLTWLPVYFVLYFAPRLL